MEQGEIWQGLKRAQVSQVEGLTVSFCREPVGTKGRPRKAAQALHDLQYLLLAVAPEVAARLVISAVSDGDTSAARILLDNLPRVDSRISLDAGDKNKLDSAAGVLDYSKNIIELTTSGALSVSPGEAMARLLEAEQLEARIEALEADRDIA